MFKIKKIIGVILILITILIIPHNSYAQDNSKQVVTLGIDNIDGYMYLFEGKRVGLITNQTGVDKNLRSTVDVLSEKVNLVALFSPEHGIRGSATAGIAVNSAKDVKTGLPIHSLYGSTKKPTAEMLKDIDILCFDIQDIGTRYYTYMYTMALAMESAQEQNIKFVVFDRPNPIGGVAVEGPVLKKGYESFIGMYEIPIRHGLTIGELALFFNNEYKLGADLTVIPMRNWQRTMFWEDTGLNWVMTSPNIPTPETALVYPGIGLFGGTNISEGVGTTRPFELVGATWLSGVELADRLNALKLPGVSFRATSFMPRFGENNGKSYEGVQIHVLEKEKYEAVHTAVTIMQTMRQMGPEEFAFNTPYRSFDIALGENSLRVGNDESMLQIFARWQYEAKEFKDKSIRYHLY